MSGPFCVTETITWVYPSSPPCLVTLNCCGELPRAGPQTVDIHFSRVVLEAASRRSRRQRTVRRRLPAASFCQGRESCHWPTRGLTAARRPHPLQRHRGRGRRSPGRTPAWSWRPALSLCHRPAGLQGCRGRLRPCSSGVLTCRCRVLSGFAVEAVPVSQTLRKRPPFGRVRDGLVVFSNRPGNAPGQPSGPGLSRQDWVTGRPPDRTGLSGRPFVVLAAWFLCSVVTSPL